MSAPYNFSNIQYGVFYGAIAIPNLINPILLGFYIDNRGFNLKVVVFLSLFLVLGLIFLIIGAIYINFWILVLGNVFLGMTVENLSMITKKVLVIIYDQKKNIVGTGVLLFFGRIGLITSTLMVPFIYDINKMLVDVYYFGVIFAILSVISLFGIYFVLPSIEINHENELSFKGIKEFFLTAEKSVYIFWVIIVLFVGSFYGLFSNANSFLVNSMSIDSTTAGVVVMPSYWGLALGILQCVMNFGQLFEPIFFSLILELTIHNMDGYFYNFISDIIICFLAILLSLLMFVTIDGKKFKGIINKL